MYRGTGIGEDNCTVYRVQWIYWIIIINISSELPLSCVLMSTGYGFFQKASTIINNYYHYY